MELNEFLKHFSEQLQFRNLDRSARLSKHMQTMNLIQGDVYFLVNALIEEIELEKVYDY